MITDQKVGGSTPPGRVFFYLEAGVGVKVICVNRKARHQYHILETYEAGLVLMGTEVKSLRDGRASIAEGFIRVKGDELFLENTHIHEYEKGNIYNHEPLRPRKILLNKREIKKIIGTISEQHVTCIPLKMYFSKTGYAKVTIAIAKGKKLYDKRQDIKKRTQEREIKKAIRVRSPES